MIFFLSKTTFDIENWPKKFLHYPTRGYSTARLLSSLPYPTLLKIEKPLLAGACPSARSWLGFGRILQKYASVQTLVILCKRPKNKQAHILRTRRLWYIPPVKPTLMHPNCEPWWRLIVCGLHCACSNQQAI